jgi:hypothetical protein
MVLPREYAAYLGGHRQPQGDMYAVKDLATSSILLSTDVDLVTFLLTWYVEREERVLFTGPCPQTRPYTPSWTRDALFANVTAYGAAVREDSADHLVIGLSDSPLDPLAALETRVLINEGKPFAILPLTPDRLKNVQTRYEQIVAMKQFPNPFLYQPRR